MRLIPLIGVLTLAAACSSPTSPSAFFAKVATAPTAVTHTFATPGTYTVTQGDTLILTLPPELGPWHGDWNDAIVKRTAFSHSSWTFQAVDVTAAGGFTLIALTDDLQWRNAVDTPLRRYYIIRVELP